MKSSSLSLTATSGTIVKNADATHEASVLHIEPNDQGITGQVALMIPVKRNEKGEVEEDQGLEPGDYNVTISLSKARQVPADGNAPLLSGSQVRGGGEPSPTRRRVGEGG